MCVKLLVAIFAAQLLVAQQAPPTSLPIGTIDGSVNPELIPDVVAFRLFFASVVNAHNQHARLRNIKLSDADENILLTKLSGFQNSMATLTATSNKAVKSDSSSQPLDGIAQTAITLLQEQLSADGFTNLLAYVQSEKKNMKRIPLHMPGMTAGASGGGK